MEIMSNQGQKGKRTGGQRRPTLESIRERKRVANEVEEKCRGKTVKITEEERATF